MPKMRILHRRGAGNETPGNMLNVMFFLDDPERETETGVEEVAGMGTRSRSRPPREATWGFVEHHFNRFTTVGEVQKWLDGELGFEVQLSHILWKKPLDQGVTLAQVGDEKDLRDKNIMVWYTKVCTEADKFNTLTRRLLPLSHVGLVQERVSAGSLEVSVVDGDCAPRVAAGDWLNIGGEHHRVTSPVPLRVTPPTAGDIRAGAHVQRLEAAPLARTPEATKGLDAIARDFASKPWEQIRAESNQACLEEAGEVPADNLLERKRDLVRLYTTRMFPHVHEALVYQKATAGVGAYISELKELFAFGDEDQVLRPFRGRCYRVARVSHDNMVVYADVLKTYLSLWQRDGDLTWQSFTFSQQDKPPPSSTHNVLFDISCFQTLAGHPEWGEACACPLGEELSLGESGDEVLWPPLSRFRVVNVRNPEVHPRACSGCQRQPLCGAHYQCKTCMGYHLCAACHNRRAQVHPKHPQSDDYDRIGQGEGQLPEDARWEIHLETKERPSIWSLCEAKQFDKANAWFNNHRDWVAANGLEVSYADHVVESGGALSPERPLEVLRGLGAYVSPNCLDRQIQKARDEYDPDLGALEEARDALARIPCQAAAPGVPRDHSEPFVREMGRIVTTAGFVRAGNAQAVEGESDAPDRCWLGCFG